MKFYVSTKNISALIAWIIQINVLQNMQILVFTGVEMQKKNLLYTRIHHNLAWYFPHINSFFQRIFKSTQTFLKDPSLIDWCCELKNEKHLSSHWQSIQGGGGQMNLYAIKFLKKLIWLVVIKFILMYIRIGSPR